MGNSEALGSQIRPSNVPSGWLGQDVFANSSVPAPQRIFAFGKKEAGGNM